MKTYFLGSRNANQLFNRKNRLIKGFSLLELLVAIIIVGILAKLAYPNYLQVIRKTHRVDATVALTDIAQKMERYYTENATYATASLGIAATDIAPTTTSGGYYTISISSQTATTYTLLATATTKGSQNSDDCGNYSINSLNVKAVSGAAGVATCW